MTVELRSSTGALDFALVTPEIISSLDEPRQQALLVLMEANRAKDAAVARKNIAVKREYDAIADESVKRQIHEDASSPIQFAPIVAKLEEQKGGPLTASEMQAARDQHALRVRALREADAREAAINAFNSSH